MSRLVDRRALFTTGAAAALLAASGVSLDAAPRRGGRLRLAVPRGDLFDAAARGALYDTLTDVGPDGLLRGELATDWTTDAQARDWRLTLRRDVRFHDGRPFTAEDAAAALAGHGVKARLDADVDVLRVVLDAPDPDLPYRLADPALVMQGPGAGDLPAGTGPYALRSLRPGRHLIADRVLPHHKDGQSAWFDSIEIAVIPDAAVRAEALRDGFVDVAALPDAGVLVNRPGLLFHPSEAEASLVAAQEITRPRNVGTRAPLDDGRIAQRWWRA
jgi:ABC-type transport system substrate-binding protein